MKTRILLILALIALFAVPGGLAQDDKPTVAMFAFGPASNQATEIGVLDVLMLFDWLSEEELASLRPGVSDLEGERINLIYDHASWDYANIQPMLEAALDQGADVLVTKSTPVSQAAVNLTREMENPVPVIFMSVFNPYAAGIAQAPCLKPDHVAGTERITDYETLLSLLTLQNPAIETIGTVYASNSSSGLYGAERIAAIGEDAGLTVEVAAVLSIADVGLAVESLVGRGVEAFVLTTDLVTSEAMPQIVGIAEENSLPVYHPNAVYFVSKATVVAGSMSTYGPGLNAGHILVGWLNGTLDLATTGVNTVTGMTIAVNVDQANAMGVEVPEDLLAQADFTQEDGGLVISPKGMTNMEFLGEMGMLAIIYPETASGSGLASEEMLLMLTQMVFPDPPEHHETFISSLQCTPEMVAEQQAALEG